jgi:hypothetical protein
MDAPAFRRTHDEPRWVGLLDGGLTVWVNLDHVRQVLFAQDADGPTALLWCADDLWEIADPRAVDAVRAWVHARALPGGILP